MRRDEINIGDEILTRYGYTAKVKGFTERYIRVFNGYKIISIHHSEIIRKYNGGRGHGESQELGNGFGRLPSGSRKHERNKEFRKGRGNGNIGESG